MKNEIKTACQNPQELFKSENFLRGIEIILKSLKLDNSDLILKMFKKVGNNEELTTIEQSIIQSVLENKDFKEKGKEILSKLPEGEINANFKNYDEFEKFGQLFKKIKGFSGLELITDTLIIATQDSTKEVIEFQEIEKFDEKGNKVKEILKKYFSESYEENNVYEHSMYYTLLNFIKYNDNYENFLKSGNEKIREKLNLFYGKEFKYNGLNSNSFNTLNRMLDNNIFAEDEISKVLSNEGLLNKLENINKYQISFLIESNSKPLLKYIEFIETEEDLIFFKLINRKFLNSNSFKKIVENYAYKQLPSYMLTYRGKEKSFYQELLEEKGNSRDYNQIPKDFHRVEVWKLIMKIGIMAYIELYERHEEELEKYLYIDINKVEKGVKGLEKLLVK